MMHSSSGKKIKNKKSRVESDNKRACLAVGFCSKPWAVVGGLNWLYCLFVLQFCSVLQLSVLFLYSYVYFLMTLSLGVSAKRTVNQWQQGSISLFSAWGASEDFAYHTSFTAGGCNSPRLRLSPQPETAVGSWDSEFHRECWEGEVLFKEPPFWKVSSTTKMKPFVQYEIFSFKPNSLLHANMICILKEM